MPRPRKSEAAHDLNGTSPEYATSEGGTDFPAGKPRMPDDLPPAAQTEWKRLVKELSRRRTITRTDASALEMYCRIWSRWKSVLAEIEAHGHTIESSWVDASGTEHTKVVESPASKIATRLESSLRALLKEFSATPASREKTRRAAAPKTKELPEGSIGWIREQMAKQQQAEETTPPPVEESDELSYDV